ncbi:MAG: DUF4125 family protein [Lachnospiraceae bacterium]|nr:DUF4125 family protein [Lachnospiraceae bacterium]
MNIEEILMRYDAMFGKNSLAEIEEYLVENIAQAKEKGEIGIVFTLLNEIIGFCRDTTQKEKGLNYCDELKELLAKMQLEGSVEYATSLQNIANAYREFGLHNEALKLFEEIINIYEKSIDSNDFRCASLYNNMALLYQEMEDYVNARDKLLSALKIVDLYEEAKIPQATTRTNLAASLLQLGTDSTYEEAIDYLKEALAIFEEDGGRDFHYGAALVAMGDAYCYKKDYKIAEKYYTSGLKEIEKHVGKTANYERVLEKCNYVKSLVSEMDEANVWKSNLERSKEFYEEYGKTMIKENFPEYEKRIAVGICGEGSDCYGFDDEISTDHDYGVGFCMWLTAEDYNKIGAKLQEKYDRLVGDNSDYNELLRKRRGVFSINGFYNNLLGTVCNFEDKFKLNYEEISESQLSSATNGLVYSDFLGVFSNIREKLLEYYPDEVWRKRLAKALHDFSQYAQSNYPRMMARNDMITAGVCIHKAVEEAMNLVYLLEHTYAPYYKWKVMGAKNLELGKKIIPLLDKITVLPSQMEAWQDVTYSSASINKADECICLFETIAKILLEELKRQNLVKGEDTFLETYIRQVLYGKNADEVDRIVNLEWKQFDKVKNEGGRADCQDDFDTFSIMRRSQYLTWPYELLESFYNDLVIAEEKGWNLIMEKYARMMKSTNPEKYKAFERDLPVLSDERIAIQEEIISIQVAWMEEFANSYPKMAGNARSIRTNEDNEWNTSYETYLRGEISTYSEKTFVLYGRFIVNLLNENKNLAYEIMENTARFYGYKSVYDAENKLL